jgi:hypothetical protein
MADVSPFKDPIIHMLSFHCAYLAEEILHSE